MSTSLNEIIIKFNIVIHETIVVSTDIILDNSIFTKACEYKFTKWIFITQ